MRAWIAAIVLAGCAPGGEAPDAGPLDSGGERPDAALRDAAAEVDAPDPTLGDASHPRQIRGAWAPSVFNLAFPSRAGLTEAQARAELETILDAMAEVRMNALFLQVRPESDALYASSLEPWSRFLTGTQGRDPGYDPLALALELAHARGIEVHAWLNPYRGMTSQTAATDAAHVTRTLSEHAHPYGTQIWMDPGAAPVREHVVAVVRDLVTRYDVDGIHFDDYFYPYRVAGEVFPDDATFGAYEGGGGTLSRDDWRRQNVHLLVEAVAGAIAEERDDVRFGISPFGIYRPGMPPGIRGLDAYAEIYCDPLPWLENEWVDYLAPQLYWPTTQTAQAFVPLLEWWGAQTTPERPILAGLNLVRLGETDAWSVQEFRDQYAAVDSHAAQNARGTIAYTIEPVLEDRLGIRAVLRDEIFARPALPPVLPRAIGSAPPAPPAVTIAGTELTIAHPDPARVRWLAIYEGGELVRVEVGATSTIDLPPGSYAITAVDRRGLESRARLVAF